MFRTFSSEEERREFGGSYFIELQYCRWKPGTEIERIISVDAIENWKDDSLYIYGDDDNKFISHYGNIFTGGVYNNGKSGVVDIYGINYYSQELTELILEQVKGMKLFNDPILLGWLETAKKYNGFYILGL
jgi:hypothetical protein